MLKAIASRAFYASKFKKPMKILKRIKHAVLKDEGLYPDEFTQMRANASGLNDANPKKVGKVLRKIAKKGQLGPAVDLMDKLGVLEYILPEVTATKGVMQNPKTHQEGTVYTCKNFLRR